MRIDGRKNDSLRQLVIKKNWNPYAEGSVEISYGNTKVLVTVTCEKETPKWKSKEDLSGWITAEYGMLPRATHTRNRREATLAQQGGRTSEIQRLIGRSLRAAIEMSEIPGLTFKIDCDVIIADGGTRTASISGAWVALSLAVQKAYDTGLISKMPKIEQVAAVSVGSLAGQNLLDLCYEEDSKADFDLNLVFKSKGDLVEIQGTAENKTISIEDLNKLVGLGWQGVSTIMQAQREAL